MTKIRTIKVGQDALTGGKNPHYALVAGRKVVATGTKDEMLELNQKTDGRVWLTHAKVDEIVEAKGPCWDTHKQVGMKKKGNRMVPNCIPKEDMASATTTASIPNPAVTAMGRMPTHIYRRKKGMEIKMTDNRFNKRKSPVLLARFRKYMTDNSG